VNHLLIWAEKTAKSKSPYPFGKKAFANSFLPFRADDFYPGRRSRPGQKEFFSVASGSSGRDKSSV